jgi:glycosyltransferase involved in cell wall biosynthesis
MRALATELGLADVVELPGRVDPEAMRGMLGGASIACLSSVWEGMPGAVMEAMACGLPVVATDVSGTREVVADGESGLLVPPCDPPALARALARLLDDPELRTRLGTAGRRRMEERFSLEAMLDAKERLYRELVERRR